MRKGEAEGGCGVIGIACAEKLAGRHLLSALAQMRNRGNGKGGGIAAAGLSPERLGVTQDILENDYMLTIGYLDMRCRDKLEKEFIHPVFDVDHVHMMPRLENFHALDGLEVKPPEAVVYFVRVKDSALDGERTSEKEDNLVYRNTYSLNRAFYTSVGEKEAFVLSHGKNLLVLKMVGYGDDVVRYYRLENFDAHVWIGHHRYPTKGSVWHPGGAHPFIGLHEALVHNGDFANYHSIVETLRQRDIHPLFLTDTEVAALLFDLLSRTCGYPLECVIEALAPTTERDFSMLPDAKQSLYRNLQKTHMHSAPDGPWFFLIARTLQHTCSLIGITDTSMLRPQVFALQTGDVPIGLAASEKQAIDAVLLELSQEDKRFWPCADHVWNARGGSHTDGGAFVFSVENVGSEKPVLRCLDKFGNSLHTEALQTPFSPQVKGVPQPFPDLPGEELFAWAKKKALSWKSREAAGFFSALAKSGYADADRARALDVLTRFLQRPIALGEIRRSCLTALCNAQLEHLMLSFRRHSSHDYAYVDVDSGRPAPDHSGQGVIVNALGFPSEGELSLAREAVALVEKGFKKLILFHCRGQRFIGSGLGPQTHGVEIAVYGSSGDYLASGIDGAAMTVYGDAQDQLAQIMNAGRLVVHGHVGQTFLYGAKGGKVFVLGNAAGRPLINAVGSPKVVVNGTCLDYLAESFMAGDPLSGGGFAIVNGLGFDREGNLVDLASPYPGSNLFSLATGGAVYVRDPRGSLDAAQLNGGKFAEMTAKDWEVMLPYLEENAQLFDISLERLLEHDGKALPFDQVYRKIAPTKLRVLQEEEAWVKCRD